VEHNKNTRSSERDFKMRVVATSAAIMALIAPLTALAAEAIAYRYDARGRLVKVLRTGSVNGTVVTDYTHDTANSRSRVKTTGAL
jgi:phage baseplate assembly protein W